MEAAPFPTPGALETTRPLPSLLAGWPDFDAMAPLLPGRVTLLDHADGLGLDLALALMADAAVQGFAVHVADGANCLDVHRLAQAGRRRAQARLPDASRRDLAAYEELVLERVRVARGFTAHQLQSIVEEGLARDAGETTGLLVAPGLLDMHLDEDVARKEAHVLAQRALGALRRLARKLDVPALVVNRALPPGRPHPLRAVLDEGVDEHVVVWRDAGAVRLDFPRRGARFLAPPPGLRRLEDFGEVDAGVRAAPGTGWGQRHSGTARYPREGTRWKEAA